MTSTSPDAVTLRALVLPAFSTADFTSADPDAGDELGHWLSAYDFSHTHETPGANAPLRYTDDGVGITPTGMGKVEAAATTTALLADPALDLSDAYFVSAGIAGAPPSVATLGSVVLADAIVDWDRKNRWAERDSPGERTIELLPYRPHDYVLRPDPDLVAEAARVGATVDLADSEEATAHRQRYPQDAARGSPTVETGATVCGDEFWHGEAIAEQAQWLVDRYDAGTYSTAEMEEYGTATALERFGFLDRHLSVRGVVNFDRPAPGQSVRESLDEELGSFTLALGLENAFRVGSRIVDHLLDTRFEDGADRSR